MRGTNARAAWRGLGLGYGLGHRLGLGIERRYGDGYGYRHGVMGDWQLGLREAMVGAEFPTGLGDVYDYDSLITTDHVSHSPHLMHCIASAAPVLAPRSAP